MTTLFISDLHLQPSHPRLLDACLRFFDEHAKHAEALYILGDLFEVWIGDDDDAAWINDFANALQQLQRGGSQLYFMHGNRDFLVGNKFANHCGMKLLPDSAVIDLYGRPTLLMHGDTLCTEDKEYLAFRAQVRNPQWQQQVLAAPIEQRRQLAAQLRAQSKMAASNKAEDIMDVTPTEVIRMMSENNVDLLIHGHTHRPARHELRVNDAPAERIVLGDWRDGDEKDGDCMWYVQAERDQSLELIKYSI
ncbi:MAG: UDP-2,3-diacylglucosamine diphosphatase [Spongiibacteraceae bacterium]